MLASNNKQQDIADPRKTSRGLILLLGVASSLSAFAMASVIPVLPLLVREFGVELASVQFVVSAYLLGLGIFQPIHGLLCDRYGRRPVLLCGFGLFFLASLFASFTTSLEFLVIARFAQSMGVSVATVVTRAIVRDSFDPVPAAIALSFMTAIMGIAPLIAPVAGGIVAELLGWKGIFWMHASVAALLVGLLFLQLRESRPAGTAAMRFGELLRGFGTLCRSSRFMGHSLTYSFTSASGFMVITIGAVVFERLFALSASGFGLLMAGISAAYIAGATSSGHLVQRRGRVLTHWLGMSISIVAITLFCVAAFSAEPRFWLFVVALSLLMFANGAISPLSLAGAVSDHAELAGVASGFSSAIAMMISMIFVILTASFYDGSAKPCALLMIGTCLLGVGSLRMAYGASKAVR